MEEERSLDARFAATGEESGKEVREYFAFLRRRKGQILVVTVLLTAVALVVAVALPAVYRSTATIRIQEQEVPPDLVKSTITSFADERIQVISQQVMTRTVLLQLIEKYGLYAKYRGHATSDEILERMRKDINLTTVNADISDRMSGRRVNATIAFTISYDAPQPERAQEVVNELVALYLDENVKVRQQSVAETTAFLAQEAERVAKQIQTIETKLAEFKRRNVGRMPDSSAVNVQLSERTEAELQRVERDLSMLQDRKLSLEAQLALVKHTAPPTTTSAAQDRSLTPEERLRALQAQYVSISAVYGPDHPDVRRVKREIAALKTETGASDKGDTDQQRKKLEADLAALKERYGDDHPDVQRARRSIAALDGTELKAATGPKASDKPSLDPIARRDNPAEVLLATQLESTQRELAHLSSVREDLRAKQRTYDARLLQIPEVEREYSELTRDYANAQKRYSEIKTKQMQAEGAVELEKELKAERFSLGEPANLPEKPFSPKRLNIALIGFVASLGTGLGLAVLREALDSSVKGPLELARIAAVPILIAIPYIETQREQQITRRRTMILVGLTSLAAGAFLLGVHLFLKPLPALAAAVLRRIATL